MCISAKKDKNVISAHKKDTLYKNSIEDSSNNWKPNERIIPSEFFPETPQNILGDNYKE